MLPTETYSGDAVPQTPWTPLVWQQGPDRLVADAQAELWQDSHEIETGILGGTQSAMAGSTPGVRNEGEQVIDGSTPGDSPSGGGGSGRADHWNSVMRDLRKTEPLAAWATGAHDGPANPQ